VRIDIVTIFPEIFEVPLYTSILGIAHENGAVETHVHDLRRWTHDRHRQVDDTPYGGGQGMVMKPEPFFHAVDELRLGAFPETAVVLLTPQGRTFDQSTAETLSRSDHLIVLCGRYEGFDERIRTIADHEISIGDYVLSGGELPALVLVEAIVRLLPNVLGHELSAAEDSFSDSLLEYPQYTRPAQWRGMKVPEVLLSGDHGKIAAWRRQQAVQRTACRRPDLLEGAQLTQQEKTWAKEIQDLKDDS